MKKTLLPIVAAVVAISAGTAHARDQIRIVGSSTVYPFTTAAAEEFGNNTKFRSPIVESTGTGGGFKLFCKGIGEDTPDFSDASRAIKKSEAEMCQKNGVTDIAEIKIGYDGIVVANSKTEKRYNLTKEQLFLALGKQVPSKGKLVDNFYQKWSEIDPSLPDEEITVYGPPPTSGTRDAFAELVLEKACKDLPEFKAVYEDKKVRGKACHMVREDGKYVEAGENDNLIVKKLQANKHSLGIFGFSFLDQNLNTIQGSVIEGVTPTFENISDGSYSVSRPLFVYAKKQNKAFVKGIKEFAQELTSDAALGADGYLSERGLIPLSKDEISTMQKIANEL